MQQFDDEYQAKVEQMNYTVILFIVVTTCVEPIPLFWMSVIFQNCHSKVMHRKEVTHSNGSYERKSRGRKLADEMGQGKAHDTLID